MEELEKLETQLAAQYKMVFLWRLDSVAVFNNTKARAFSKRNTQSEHKLHQLRELHRLCLWCLDY